MRAKIIVGIAAAALVVIGMATFRPAPPQARFTTLTGETVSSAELRGRVVLVNFWATYCPSCVQEMPKIAETHKKFAPRGFETLAVAVRHDSLARVADFAAKRALPFKVAFDGSGDIAQQFGNVRVTPTSFLLDRQGRVLRRYVGEPDWSELHALVERELGP